MFPFEVPHRMLPSSAHAMAEMSLAPCSSIFFILDAESVYAMPPASTAKKDAPGTATRSVTSFSNVSVCKRLVANGDAASASSIE